MRRSTDKDRLSGEAVAEFVPLDDKPMTGYVYDVQLGTIHPPGQPAGEGDGLNGGVVRGFDREPSMSLKNGFDLPPACPHDVRPWTVEPHFPADEGHWLPGHDADRTWSAPSFGISIVDHGMEHGSVPSSIVKEPAARFPARL